MLCILLVSVSCLCKVGGQWGNMAVNKNHRLLRPRGDPWDGQRSLLCFGSLSGYLANTCMVIILSWMLFEACSSDLKCPHIAEVQWLRSLPKVVQLALGKACTWTLTQKVMLEATVNTLPDMVVLGSWPVSILSVFICPCGTLSVM